MELGSLLRKASLLLGAPHGTLEPSFLIIHSMCFLSLPHAVQVYQLTTEIRHDLLIWTPNGFQRLFSVKKRTLCFNGKNLWKSLDFVGNLWKIGKVMFLNKTTFSYPGEISENLWKSLGTKRKLHSRRFPGTNFHHDTCNLTRENNLKVSIKQTCMTLPQNRSLTSTENDTSNIK